MTTKPDPNPTRFPERLLGVWAHPDDEAYLSADLMAGTVEAGGSVTLVTVTDGEAGFGPDDHRSRGAKAAHRRAELADAMAAIGVRDIRYVGVPDGEVSDHRSGLLLDRITRLMRQVAPEVTVTFGPDGITGHPDHVACGRLVTRAWSETRIGELWYATKSDLWLRKWDELNRRLGVIVSDPAGDDGGAAGSGAAGTVVRHVTIDGDRLTTKRRVLAAHRSQTEAIAAVMGEDAYLEWIAEECFRHPSDVELFDADPNLAVVDWCRPQLGRSWS